MKVLTVFLYYFYLKQVSTPNCCAGIRIYVPLC